MNEPRFTPEPPPDPFAWLVVGVRVVVKESFETDNDELTVYRTHTTFVR